MTIRAIGEQPLHARTASSRIAMTKRRLAIVRVVPKWYAPCAVLCALFAIPSGVKSVQRIKDRGMKVAVTLWNWIEIGSRTKTANGSNDF